MDDNKMVAKSLTLPEALIQQLQAIADREYEGNLSQTVRKALKQYVDQQEGMKL